MNFGSLVCDGCLSDGHIAFHCKTCKMRLCAADKPDVIRCSDCTGFPCFLLTDFSKNGKLHHAALLDNLRNLRKMGIKDWIRVPKSHIRQLDPAAKYLIDFTENNARQGTSVSG